MVARFEHDALVTVEIFVGLTAVAGGLALLTGMIAMPIELLDGTPFSNYAIPGLILAIVVGGGNLLAAMSMLRHDKIGPTISIVGGVAIIGWIVVQVAMVGSISWLQPFYLTIGIVIAAIGLHLRTPALAT